ncbi:hypothetical protein BKA18_004091 [Streptomyces auratus]
MEARLTLESTLPESPYGELGGASFHIRLPVRPVGE